MFVLPLIASVLTTHMVELPTWKDTKGLEHYASQKTYSAARSDTRFRMEKFDYPSDDLIVSAYIYGPQDNVNKLPVIIFNRGSWVRDSFAAEMLPMAHRFAKAGFLVVAPMYRGSGGAKGRDEMGGADLDDLFNLLPVLSKLPQADTDRVFLYGESRGGMMVYQALRDGFPAKAAATYGAFTDLRALLADPQWNGVAETIWLDFDKHEDEIIQRRSALAWTTKIKTPLLIMHGGNDGAVSPNQTLSLANKLEANHACYELWIAAGDDHVLSANAKERDQMVANWFAQNAKTNVCAKTEENPQ